MSGWKLVPVEATRAMDEAGMAAIGFGDDTEAAHRAMVTAAPSPPEDVLERMARAFFDAWEESQRARRGVVRTDEEHDAYNAQSRIQAMRAALAAAEERT